MAEARADAGRPLDGASDLLPPWEPFGQLSDALEALQWANSVRWTDPREGGAALVAAARAEVARADAAVMAEAERVWGCNGINPHGVGACHHGTK